MISRKLLAVITGAIALIIVLLFTCNKKPKPPVKPSVVDVINNEYKAKYDSLALAYTGLQHRYDSLKTKDSLIEIKKIAIKTKAPKLKEAVAVAEVKKDTVALVLSLKESLANCEAYNVEADRQADVRGHRIETLEEQNKNLLSEKAMDKIKFARLADSTRLIEIRLTAAENKVYKKDKQVKRLKNVAKATIVIAIIEGILIYVK